MSGFSCKDVVCGTGDWSGPKPGDPDNNSVLYARSAFGGIDVGWTYPGINPHAVAHVILFKSTSSDPTTMVQHAIVDGSYFFDRTESATPIEYFYWIKIVSINGTVGDLIGPASSMARSGIEDTIEALTGKIDAGVLAKDLKTEIDRIKINALNLDKEILERAINDDALGAAFNEIQAFSEETRALVQTEALARAEADSAFVGVANTLYANIEQNTGSIQELSQVIVDKDNAMAEKIDRVEVQMGQEIAQAEQSLTTEIQKVGGEVKKIGALWTAKVSVNGLIGGFGVYNDGRTVEAGFDVDTFWIGRTGADAKKPFIVSGGEVFINGAVINSLTFNKLRADDNSLAFANGKLQAKHIAVDQLNITNANIKGDLKSDNYVPGVSGWIIKK